MDHAVQHDTLRTFSEPMAAARPPPPPTQRGSPCGRDGALEKGQKKG